MKAKATRAAMLVGVLLLLALPGRASAPPGRYTFPAAGTVLDTFTQLTWEQTASTTAVHWDQALGHCQGLSLAGTGWRVPTLKELATLVDERAVNPAIDTTAFPAAPAVLFWSSTPYSGNGTASWSISFTDGNSQFYNNGSNCPTTCTYVRCVR